MSLAFIEFEARILGLSLETKIFLIRKKGRKKGQSHIWRRASALPKKHVLYFMQKFSILLMPSFSSQFPMYQS